MSIYSFCYRYLSLTDELVLNLFLDSKNFIDGVGYILCSAALWAYNAQDLIPDQLLMRIEAYWAQNLIVKRIRVIADEE